MIYLPVYNTVYTVTVLYWLGSIFKNICKMSKILTLRSLDNIQNIVFALFFPQKYLMVLKEVNMIFFDQMINYFRDDLLFY